MAERVIVETIESTLREDFDRRVTKALNTKAQVKILGANNFASPNGVGNTYTMTVSYVDFSRHSRFDKMSI